MIYIDTRHPHCVTDDFLKNLKQDEAPKENLGLYYPAYNYANTISIMRKITLPAAIPTSDMVSEIPFDPDTAFPASWKDCHQQFSQMHPKNQSITALGCGHYIFLENPLLVINTIVKTYCSIINEKQKVEVLNRNLEYAIVLANDLKKQEMNFKHSEEDINAWAYRFLQQGELQKALEIFKLNVFLYPSSWNVYDSYGEALLKNGQKEAAIRMYQKSVELNPTNDNGKKELEKISK